MAATRSLPPDENPYAPSAVVDPRLDLTEAGVGVWRDGNYVVLHHRATLPAICLKTGAPATHWFVQKFTGHEKLFSLQTRRYEVCVPLSARRFWMAKYLGRWLLAVGVLTMFGLAWMALYVDRWPRQFQALGIFGVMSLAATLLIYGAFLGEPVQARRFRGDYLWLSGADERFLVHLPPWPGP